MDDGKRSNSPTGNPPSVGRTPTPSELAHEIRELRKLLQRPDIERRLERVEAVASHELLPFIRETGASYDAVAATLAGLTATVAAQTEALSTFRGDVREDLADHDGRLLAVEDRSAGHHVRLSTIDELEIDSRLRTLEQHQAGDARELSLTRRQKTGMAALATAGGGISWLISHLLGG